MYYISPRCAHCGGCRSRCPEKCIDASVHPLVIDQLRCTGCGRCFLACPIRAIVYFEDKANISF
ncbi:MAG: DUF362 domain-containing protein [Oscillospiraceae bacterium]